jgi:hypothetical protein
MAANTSWLQKSNCQAVALAWESMAVARVPAASWRSCRPPCRRCKRSSIAKVRRSPVLQLLLLRALAARQIVRRLLRLLHC